MRKKRVTELLLEDSFIDLIISGQKKSTVRFGFVFPEDNILKLLSSNRSVDVELTMVNYSVTFGSLNQDDAINDGFKSLEELKNVLKGFYPSISDNDQMTILHFKYTKK
jgi:hypothetical protein